MRKMTRHVLGAAGLALIVTTSVVWAQEAQPVRVRGEIAKVEGNTLSIKSRNGQNLTVKLADDARIAAMVKASRCNARCGRVQFTNSDQTALGRDGLDWITVWSLDMRQGELKGGAVR